MAFSIPGHTNGNLTLGLPSSPWGSRRDFHYIKGCEAGKTYPQTDSLAKSSLDVYTICSMGVETIGEALSLGWRVVARCARGHEDGLAAGQAGNAPINGSWTWKRLSARATGPFRYQFSKVG